MTESLKFKEITIEDFFSKTGIIREFDPHEPKFWEDLWQRIREKGVDPDEILNAFHPMSPEVSDLYFMDEDIGLRFLSADIERFKMILMNIETHEGFAASPKRIIDIGGGPGIISLWLAAKFKDSECIVYDISERALNIGRLLAQRLEINNIDFRKASYLELSKMKNPEKGDLVLGLSALFLKISPEKESDHFSAETASNSFTCQAREMTSDFIKACSNLVQENGMVYFSQGAFNDLGLLALFSALRTKRLGIDWQLTKVSGKGSGAGFSFNEIHIFAKPGLPSIFKNAREDLRTFLYSGKNLPDSAPEFLGHADYEAWLGLLSDGVKISEIITKKDDQTFEKFILLCKSGILGFFSASSTGRRSGFIGPAADFMQAGNRLKSAIDKYIQNEIEIISEYWHPDYEKLISL